MRNLLTSTQQTSLSQQLIWKVINRSSTNLKVSLFKENLIKFYTNCKRGAIEKSLNLALAFKKLNLEMLSFEQKFVKVKQ